MELKVQRKLAGKVLKCSPYRVKFDSEKLSDIKEAITKSDIRSLIGEGAIVRKKVKGISRARARKISIQKKKGRRKGKGSRKGPKKSRLPKKQAWIYKVRVQRNFLREMKSKGLLSLKNFRTTYNKVKGGFFRSRRHIKLFLEEKGFFEK